jgi:hypothetical protein
MSATTLRAQVTIGSLDEPKATLDVRKGTAKADGIIPPVLTGDELAGNDAKYGTDQTGAIVYVTAAVASPTTKTANVTAAGYYFFDGSIWQLLKGTAGSEVDGVIGNEVLDTSDGTLVRSGTGSATDPYKLKRAAITGDVDVPAGSNAATIANNAVNSAKIADGTVTSADIADGTIVVADMADAAITASNGLTESPKNNIKLGGTLSENTTIAHGSYTLTHSGTGKEIISTPLQYNYSGASAGAGKVLTSDANGNATWTNKAPTAYKGTTATSDVTLGQGISSMKYTGFYVDVPAGTSMVSFGCLVQNQSTSVTDGGYATFTLATSSSSYSPAPASWLNPALGSITVPAVGRTGGGQCVWFVTSSAAMRLYVWGCCDGGCNTVKVLAVGKAESFIHCDY